jgi:hypothetical protein
MARSRREQREQLQQAMQAKRPEPAKSVEQSKPEVPRNDAGVSDFSRDPSPFSKQLPPDSSAYRELVAIAAYYRAERRGFAPGGEIEDWLDAEREVAARLNEARPA